jgi:hypothetical protein
MSDAFDNLGRLAASGVSRRQLLRNALALAVTSAFSSWLFAGGTARAGTVGKVGDCPTPTAGTCPNGTVPYSPTCSHKIPNGTASSYNGCGPESGIDIRYAVYGPLGVALPPIKAEPPDNPFWLGNFVNACNAHDCCYGTCGADKARCDSDFRSGLHAACAAGGASTKAVRGVLGATLGIFCDALAETYYAAVAGGGAAAFEQGQAEVCDCCCDGTCPEPCGPDGYCNTKSCRCVVYA